MLALSHCRQVFSRMRHPITCYFHCTLYFFSPVFFSRFFIVIFFFFLRGTLWYNFRTRHEANKVSPKLRYACFPFQAAKRVKRLWACLRCATRICIVELWIMWVHGSRAVSDAQQQQQQRNQNRNQNSQQTQLWVDSALFVVCQQLGTFFFSFLGSKRCTSVWLHLLSRSLLLSPSLCLPAFFNIVFHLISALSDALTVNATCACSVCNTFCTLSCDLHSVVEKAWHH